MNEGERGETGHPTGRLLFLDNLRWLVIVLVISMHAADTYSPLGNWYFVDRRPLSRALLIFFAAWQTYLQAFFMGLLFFIAGYFVPGSLKRKGRGKFLADRSKRLGLPVLFYMLVLGPITEYYVAHSWTSSEPTSFAREWARHIANGQVWQENGPLWFCVALLLFSTVYAAAAGWISNRGAVKVRTETLFKIALLIASVTFVVRGLNPPSMFNLPLKDFGQYVILFVAGTVSARKPWFEEVSERSGWWSIGWTLTLALAVWCYLIVAGGALDGHGADYTGGWHWQNAAFSLWESFTCVAICFGLLAVFRWRWSRQGTAAHFLSANAFGVYVFHPPILILLARLLQPSGWNPLAKFAILTLTTAVATFVLSEWVFRRLPGLSSILR